MGQAQRSVLKATAGLDARDSQLSRRKLFRSLATFMTMLGMASLAGSEAAYAQTKNTQAAAKYQDHPNNGASCAMCNYFRPPHSCQIVEGTISPAGWCSFFLKKSS